MYGEMKGQSPGEAYNQVGLISGILRYLQLEKNQRRPDLLALHSFNIVPFQSLKAPVLLLLKIMK